MCMAVGLCVLRLGVAVVEHVARWCHGRGSGSLVQPHVRTCRWAMRAQRGACQIVLRRSVRACHTALPRPDRYVTWVAPRSVAVYLCVLRFRVAMVERAARWRNDGGSGSIGRLSKRMWVAARIAHVLQWRWAKEWIYLPIKSIHQTRGIHQNAMPNECVLAGEGPPSEWSHVNDHTLHGAPLTRKLKVFSVLWLAGSESKAVLRGGSV